MKKNIGFLIVLICILILTACNGSKLEDVDIEIDSTNHTIEDKKPQTTSPDLNTEKGIKEYLLGKWLCKIEYMSNTVVEMDVDGDLNIELSFYDYDSNESKGHYNGKIILDRIYVNSNESPDIIRIELDDSKYPEGSFFFLHRTIYDGKRVMSLFFSGKGKSVFNILAGDDSDYIIEELMFEKETGERSSNKLRKDEEFYGVFWGHGVHYQSIWIDYVEWTPYLEYKVAYPLSMTVYQNDRPGSILYQVDPNQKFDILGDDMFKGTVYYIKTDGKGNIIELIDAEYKEFLEKSREEYDDSGVEGHDDFETEEYDDMEIEDEIFHIIDDLAEIQEYLDQGMSILYTGELTIIDGQECYNIYLGTDHEESFVREIHYCVNIVTEKVYRYDVLNDIWECL